MNKLILLILVVGFINIFFLSFSKQVEPDKEIKWVECHQFTPRTQLKRKLEVNYVDSFLNSQTKDQRNELLKKFPLIFTSKKKDNNFKHLNEFLNEIQKATKVPFAINEETNFENTELFNFNFENLPISMFQKSIFKFIQTYFSPLIQKFSKTIISLINTFKNIQNEDVESVLERASKPKMNKKGEWYKETIYGFKPTESPFKKRDDVLNPPNAQCSNTKVPLLWTDKNDDRTISIFVKRFLVPETKTKRKDIKGQIYFLQGGPGGDSTVFEHFIQKIMRLTKYQYDIYLPDHRGTGRSSFFSCSKEKSMMNQVTSESDLKFCYQEKEKEFGKNNGIYGWGSTQAAHDLIYVMNTVKKEMKDKGVNNYKTGAYGVSYGTYWLNRLLTNHGDKIDFAIADSIVAPPFDFSDWDAHYVECGRNMMKLCKEDKFCSIKFQKYGGIEKAMKNMFEIQKSDSKKKCHSIIDNEFLRKLMSIFIQLPVFRKLVLPIVYRINHCKESDVKWLDNLLIMGVLMGVRPKIGLKNNKIDKYNLNIESQIKKINNLENLEKLKRKDEKNNDQVVEQYKFPHELYRTIVCSELMKKPLRTIEEIEKKYSTYPPYFYIQAGPQLIKNCKVATENQLYKEPLYDKMSTIYKNPLLSIQGDLDPQTPYNQTMKWKKHYNTFMNKNGTKHHFIKFKNSAHGAAFATPMKDDHSEICGLNIVGEFILNPDKEIVNTECLKKWMDYDFDFNEPTSEKTTSILMWNDLWMGGPTVSLIDYLMYIIKGIVVIVIVLLISICCCCCCACGIIGYISFRFYKKYKGKNTHYEQFDEFPGKNEDEEDDLAGVEKVGEMLKPELEIHQDL